jgi:predicted tellurium resistance membrane protein TerC
MIGSQRSSDAKDVLALSFLPLIGMTLIADSAGFRVLKAYIYVAIGFSVAVGRLTNWRRGELVLSTTGSRTATMRIS